MIEKIIFNLKNFFNLNKDIYVFCFWIWIASILYFFNLLPFSLFYLSFISVFLTIPYQFFISKQNIYRKIIVIFIESNILLMNYYKHFYYDKKKLIEFNDILFNIVLFIIYNVFLLINKKTIIDLYLKPPFT
tara:strand:- start:257 stop:652 length:396 start_codon:yes stop_codon:yes gene_type:complete